MAASLHNFINIFDMKIEHGEEEIPVSKVVIPIIQRSYAQGRTDIETTRKRERFLDSLYMALTSKPINLDFIYGDIDGSGRITPLDGQQRLTTLFLLHWYAAKKENIDEKKWKFLEKFSYETRYSARDFCKFLIDFMPSFQKKLSYEIIDQYWFPLDWKKDPTIAAMLTMIDAIDEKFNEVDSIWQKLEEDAITFYFLPILDMGLTDELYIKMNSRGKLLTQFEHFKAELERNIREVDEEKAKTIADKIDREWTDFLWKYRNSENLIDDFFLRFFRFICDIITYEMGDTPQGKNNDEFYLLKKYFSKSCPQFLENISKLENYFDSWAKINSEEFLKRHISHTHEEDKIKIDTRHEIDILKDCLYTYVDVKSHVRYFTFGKIILLYFITEYLIHSDEIEPSTFQRRLRIIDNLIKNSTDEFSDSETRVNGNRIPACLKNAKHILLTGTIDAKITLSFNNSQLIEEQEKIVWLEKNADKASTLYRLEDHSLLEGQIGIVGLEYYYLFDRFIELFDCRLDLVDCALMTIGFYGQQERTSWRYQLGSAGNRKAWFNLFHKSSNKGYEKTRAILVDLLLKEEHMTNDYLLKLIANFIEHCEKENEYSFAYYYVKYDVFRPGSYGKYNFTNVQSMYEVLVLQTEKYLSSSSYMPFLKELDPVHLSKDYLGKRLSYNEKYVECTNDAYLIKNTIDGSLIEEIKILQRFNVDCENRIEKMRSKIEELKK